MAIPVEISCYDSEDANFLAEAKEAMQQFLTLGSTARERLAPLIWKNCTDFLECIEEDPMDDHLRAITQADQIWDYVQPTNLQIIRHYENKQLYLLLQADCDWEQEHGLELSFKAGHILTSMDMILYSPKDDGFLYLDLSKNQ